MTLNKTNIDPKIWGPYFWETFHLSTAGYPVIPTIEEISSYKEFYISFMKILPCQKCSRDALDTINYSGLDEGLKSRDNLILWGYNFHDIVNKKLNKTSPSFESFSNKINGIQSTTSFRGTFFEDIFSFDKIALFIVFCIALFFVFKNYT